MMNSVPHLFDSSETMIFAVSVLIQATLVIVVALLLGRWLRHQPALRHSVLLGGLMCVCFCPVATYLADRSDVPLISITWPSNAVSHPHPTAPATARESTAAPSRESVSSPEEAPNILTSLPPRVTAGQSARQPGVLELDSVHRQPAREQVTGAFVTAIPDEVPSGLSSSKLTQRPVWMNVANIAGLIWLAGMVVISIRLLLAWRYLSRLRSNASPHNEQGLPQLRQVSEEVLRAVAAKRLPPLLVSDQVKGPISLGLFRPAIVLPREMTLALNASQLRDILIHETAHIHRHDHVVVLLQRLAGAFFWPFPLVWRLNTKIDEAREDVCDNYVLRHTEASQYSRMLLELTERAAPPQAIPLAVGLWECRRKLEQRVAALLDPRRTTKTRLPRRTLIALGVAFMSIAVLLAGSRITPTSRAQAEESQQSTDEGEKQSAKDVEKKDASGEAKPVAGPARDRTDPYDTLYDVIMTRYGKDGKSYAQDESSPAIFAWSEFPFDDKTFDKFNAALAAFAALPQKNIDEYSDVKRALMQRHLWKVFDTTFNWDWPADWWWSGRKSFPKSHLDRRAAVQPKIAALIRRLALARAEIMALPNPMAATVKSGEFAQAHDPADRFKPFLPADLYSKESSWICLGEDGDEIPASEHTSKLNSRSMFLQFMRLPGGRDETLEYMERVKKQVRQFPVGTQFALIEQQFLISKEGELVLSPLIVSVQLRAYLNVGRRFNRFEDDPKPTQCVAEFVMQPRELMKGNAVMKAMGPDDFRYDAGAPDSVGFNPRDPFATGNISEGMPKLTRLNNCMSCHSGAGSRGVRTGSFTVTNVLKESSVEEISKATSAQKRDDEQWKALQTLWQGKPLPKDDDAKMVAKAEPAKQPEDKPDKYPDDPKLRTALMTRIETEVAVELKNLHTAVLHAEVAKLSEMFDLEETEISRLRHAAQGAANSAVEKTRDSLMAAVKKNASYMLNTNDVDMTAVRVNGRYIRLDASPNDQDSDEKNPWHDNLRVTVYRRASSNWLSFRFTSSHTNTVRPKDSDVQSEELWKKELSAVLTKEQLGQYTELTENRLKTTVVDMILTAMQFDLDLQESQLPVVRRRIEERIKLKSSTYYDIERTVGRDLQRLKAEDLADILPKEQLDRFVEHTKGSIKSTIVTLILTALQFDLHLPDSRLPVVRKRLEERINPGPLNRSIDSAAMRIRWTLKAKDVADILTESQLTLWLLTQEQH